MLGKYFGNFPSTIPQGYFSDILDIVHAVFGINVRTVTIYSEKRPLLLGHSIVYEFHFHRWSVSAAFLFKLF
jgi:hypothetical protein